MIAEAQKLIKCKIVVVIIIYTGVYGSICRKFDEKVTVADWGGGIRALEFIIDVFDCIGVETCPPPPPVSTPELTGMLPASA